jgi:CRISPR-associated protein Csb1
MKAQTQSDTQLTEQFYQLLNNKGAVALVMTKHLQPVAGAGTVIQPASYADHGYLTWTGGSGGVIIDSVQSQANRMETIFTQSPYDRLVPQVIIEQTDGSTNLLDIGHRLADAVVRYSSANPTVHAAFASAKRGNFTPLAKLNPTALVLGVWDSRDTRVKIPRALTSQIEARGIRTVRDRAATFFSSATDATKVLAGVTEDGEMQPSEKKTRGKLSAEGFNNALDFTEKRGGITADEIVRTSIISLPLTRSKGDATLQAYLFALALVMFTSEANQLRSGTLLVSDPNRPVTVEVVYEDGKHEPTTITCEGALRFAQETAATFGVGENKTFKLDDSTYKAAVKVLDGKNGKSADKSTGKSKKPRAMLAAEA